MVPDATSMSVTFSQTTSEQLVLCDFSELHMLSFHVSAEDSTLARQAPLSRVRAGLEPRSEFRNDNNHLLPSLPHLPRLFLATAACVTSDTPSTTMSASLFFTLTTWNSDPGRGSHRHSV